MAERVFDALGKPLPDFKHLSSQDQARALFSTLNTTKEPRLIVLDQFENMLNWQTGEALPTRPEVSEWLSVLNKEACACRILLTSRLVPRGMNEGTPLFLQEYKIDGLEYSEGVNLLRKRGVSRQQETDDELQKAVLHTNGHPLALTILASILQMNPSIKIAYLFGNSIYNLQWKESISAHELMNYLYDQQLNDTQRKLLRAFSLYREPVPLEGALVFMEKIPEKQTLEALNVLLRQFLLQAIGEGRYQLHSIIATYAQSRFDKRSEKMNKKALQAAHQQVVGYYLHSVAACLPRARRKQVSDVRPFIEAFWHHIQARQWQEAYTLLKQEQLFTHLHGWGDNVTLLELYQLLFPLDKWSSDSLPLTHISGEVGQIYSALGQPPQALEYHKQALQIATDENFQREQAEALYYLGTVYDDLGNKRQALQYYEQALLLYEEVEDDSGKRQALSKLAWVYHFQGEKERARRYSERALLLCREVGDRRGEAAALQTMGWIYHEDIKQAQDYEKQALYIFRELKDRGGEAWTLANLGVLCDVFFEKKQYFDKALEQFKEAGDQRGEAWTIYNLGDLYFLESSSSNQKEQARQYLEQAWGLFLEVEDRTGEGAVLHRLGSVYFSLGRKRQAKKCLVQALNIFKASGDVAWKGRLLRVISDCYIEQHCFDIALASLLLARECFEKLQRSREKEEIQGQIDALCREVGEQQFALLLTQVEAKAFQVVEQGLSSLSPEEQL